MTCPNVRGKRAQSQISNTTCTAQLERTLAFQHLHNRATLLVAVSLLEYKAPALPPPQPSSEYIHFKIELELATEAHDGKDWHSYRWQC